MGMAQQDAQYTQYMYNTITVNPAYAGSRETLSMAVLYRSQWLGIDGAPTTQTFTLSTPVSERVGIGLSIVNDEIGNGTNRDTYFDGVFSYTIPTSPNGKLSFGLKAGGQLLSIDFNKLRNYDPQASGNMDDFYNSLSFNFGSGVYYRSERFYAGVSVPNFVKVKHFNNQSKLITERSNWYFISGYVFDLDTEIKLKPAILLKAVSGAPLQADISGTFLIHDKFSVGASYRWDAALSTLIGFQLNGNFMIGLAYDTEMSELGSNTFDDGSFEVFVRYELRKRTSKDSVPRFF